MDESVKISYDEIKYFFDISIDIDFFDREENPPIQLANWRKLEDLYFDFCIIHKQNLPVTKKFVDDYNLKLLSQAGNPDYFEERAAKFMNRRSIFSRLFGWIRER